MSSLVEPRTPSGARYRVCRWLAICIGCAPRVGLSDTLYVSPSGSHVSPFASWETAATDIQSAVDAAMAGDTVLVTNGTYVLSSEISITNGITVASVNGSEFTTVQEDGFGRCFQLVHSNAKVDGLRIISGGVDMSGGTVQYCTISSNSVEGIFGGGVRMSGVYAADSGL